MRMFLAGLVVTLILSQPTTEWSPTAQAGVFSRAARAAGDWLTRKLVRPASRGTAMRPRHLVPPGASLARSAALPSIARLGTATTRIVGTLAPRNARRLAILADSGELARIGRTREILAVVERFCDRAMEFIWRHKGALATSALLATFLNDPEPFLNGARDLTRAGAKAVICQLVTVPQRLVQLGTIPHVFLIIAIGGLTTLLLQRLRYCQSRNRV